MDENREGAGRSLGPFSRIREYKASWEATETMKRYPVVTIALVLGVVFGVMLAAPTGGPAISAAEEPSLLQIDNDFFPAVSKHDKGTVGRLLDTEFTWAGAPRKTQNRADVLQYLPAPA